MKWTLAVTVLVILAAVLLLSVDEDAPAPQRPNILLVVLDDFGYGDLAINTDSDSPTPNLDDFARQGIRFTRHCTESSCAPSRAALLTGQYAARNGFHPNGNGLDAEVVTLPDLLAEEGYTNHMLGKWHLGGVEKLARPEHQGFHHWLGFINQVYLAGSHESGVYTPGRPRYGNPWLENERGEMRRHEGHLNDILTRRALEVVDTATTPWFMYLSYFAPHTPMQPALRFAQQFPDTEIGRYQALKAQLDDNLGKIFSQIRASGMWRDTLIIVVSDNGATSKAYPGNKPFQGIKAGYREGGIRTPLIVSWPARWEGEEVRDDITMIFDIYPSIAQALGRSVADTLDGRPLFPVTLAESRELRWYSHQPESHKYSMLTADGKWRLLVWEDVIRTVQNELEFLGEEYREKRPGELLLRMSASMEDWRSDVTRVKDIASKDYDGWRHYHGRSIRRTPLNGTYSIGFPIATAEAGLSEASLVLLEQTGFLQVSIEGDELKIVFDQQHLSAPFPRGPGECKSIVVTASLNKKQGVFYEVESPSQVSVYVDGQLATATEYQNFDKSTESPSNPLRVRIQGSSRLPTASDVFLSTRAIDAEEVANELHPELLGDCAQAI